MGSRILFATLAIAMLACSTAGGSTGPTPFVGTYHVQISATYSLDTSYTGTASGTITLGDSSTTVGFPPVAGAPIHKAYTGTFAFTDANGPESGPLHWWPTGANSFVVEGFPGPNSSAALAFAWAHCAAPPAGSAWLVVDTLSGSVSGSTLTLNGHGGEWACTEPTSYGSETSPIVNMNETVN